MRIIVLILLIIFLVILIYYPLITLSDIAHNETSGLTDDKDKAIAITAWFKKNYSFPNKQDIFYQAKLLFMQNISISFWTKTVDCVGAANIFTYMSQSVGIESRKVGTSGETHFWAEFKYDNNWLNIDPFNDQNGNTIGDLNLYSAWDSDQFGKRFSFVYWEDEKGVHNITSKYRETGKIQVVDKTTDTNPKIVIMKSHHLMEVSPNYTQPFMAFTGYTENRMLEQEFGRGNNYTVEMIQVAPYPLPIFVYGAEKEIYLDKNELEIITFDKLEFKGISDISFGAILGAIIILTSILSSQIFKKIIFLIQQKQRRNN
jgi:hypothetical protein